MYRDARHIFQDAFCEMDPDLIVKVDYITNMDSMMCVTITDTKLDDYAAARLEERPDVNFSASRVLSEEETLRMILQLEARLLKFLDGEPLLSTLWMCQYYRKESIAELDADSPWAVVLACTLVIVDAVLKQLMNMHVFNMEDVNMNVFDISIKQLLNVFPFVNAVASFNNELVREQQYFDVAKQAEVLLDELPQGMVRDHVEFFYILMYVTYVCSCPLDVHVIEQTLPWIHKAKNLLEEVYHGTQGIDLSLDPHGCFIQGRERLLLNSMPTGRASISMPPGEIHSKFHYLLSKCECILTNIGLWMTKSISLAKIGLIFTNLVNEVSQIAPFLRSLILHVTNEHQLKHPLYQHFIFWVSGFIPLSRELESSLVDTIESNPLVYSASIAFQVFLWHCKAENKPRQYRNRRKALKDASRMIIPDTISSLAWRLSYANEALDLIDLGLDLDLVAVGLFDRVALWYAISIITKNADIDENVQLTSLGKMIRSRLRYVRTLSTMNLIIVSLCEASLASKYDADGFYTKLRSGSESSLLAYRLHYAIPVFTLDDPLEHLEEFMIALSSFNTEERIQRVRQLYEDARYDLDAYADHAASVSREYNLPLHVPQKTHFNSFGFFLDRLGDIGVGSVTMELTHEAPCVIWSFERDELSIQGM